MYKLVMFFFIFVSINTFGQNNLDKINDIGRINITPFIPTQNEFIDENVSQNLSNKLNLIINNNGLNVGSNSRFVLTPHFTIESKEISSTTPVMISIVLNVSFYVGDIIDGMKFTSTNISAKGVGKTDNKAIMFALKNINVNDKRFNNLIEDAKLKIIEYYNTKCDFIIKDANTLASLDKYDESIYKLLQVPIVCKSCFEQAQESAISVYKLQIEKQCRQDLSSAKIIWYKGQDLISAEKVSDILSKVNINAPCFIEVQKFVKIVADRVKEINNREWNFKTKQYQSELDSRLASINAIREIGVSYGNNQPRNIKISNVVKLWW